jgi:hypothetical protein
MCVIRGLILRELVKPVSDQTDRGTTLPRRGFAHFPESECDGYRNNLAGAGQASKLMGWRLSCDYKRLATAGGVGNWPKDLWRVQVTGLGLGLNLLNCSIGHGDWGFGCGAPERKGSSLRLDRWTSTW